ncbi:hypothetical protein PanWU01x14_201250 [Parasponia andersonii]|uniref:Uncharacterized protein n=1 Tax=Parasponia andersonii TaxID=3476 RepID=A0A2P5BXN4_PARAD|nr:hypothetical protein PanWU01x14_201250 [Parasponia andersonii]
MVLVAEASSDSWTSTLVSGAGQQRPEVAQRSFAGNRVLGFSPGTKSKKNGKMEGFMGNFRNCSATCQLLVNWHCFVYLHLDPVF